MTEPIKNTDTQSDIFSNIKHVVVLMMENRSFDNLLGNLYKPGDLAPGQQFAGLKFGGPYYNTVPDDMNDGHAGEKIFTYASDDLTQPYPDPGEEYPHINTQLYGQLDKKNEGKLAYQMKKPYNLPDPVPCPAKMDGFVKDYINNLQSTFGGVPADQVTYDQYKVIMQCFENEQIPVLSQLAKEFAVFDHWFCSVPSQTWCNRSFWHAASSGGKVINALEEYGNCFLSKIFDSLTEMSSWVRNVWSLPTIFGRMTEKNITWNIYSRIAPLSMTTIVNGEFDNIKSYKKSFQTDINNGNLPQYSFVEPQFFFTHDDLHPYTESKKNLPATLKLGDSLILEVYNAIKNSDKYRDNTLLIITFDEHGGCYDHVPPPCSAVPPGPGKGQMGFPFNRPGIRVPMVMISSWIKPNTIVNEEFEHTSFIRAISEKWNLGTLTNRDASVKPFTDSNVFSTEMRSKPWPEIHLKDEDRKSIEAVSEFDKDDDEPNHLQYAMLNALLYMEKKRGLSKTPRASVKTNGDIRKVLNRLIADMNSKK
jgi:phospholipase C